MSTTTRITLSEAICHAEAFRDLFADCYDTWVIAGSVRRLKPTIGDCEHVLLPRWTEPQLDLLGSVAVGAKTLVRERVNELLAAGAVTLHRYGESQTTRNGELYIGLDYRGRLHEIFMANPDNFGCQLVIRTGNADFSQGMVTRFYRYGYRQDMGFLHKVGDRGQLKRVPCPDEETFFKAAGLDVRDWPPERRERCP